MLWFQRPLEEIPNHSNKPTTKTPMKTSTTFAPYEKKQFPKPPIEPIVSQHIALKKKGTLLIGLCCFHSETTPSFTVYEYHAHCFGCNWHGDAVDFLRQKMNITVQEAMKIANEYSSNHQEDVWPNS